MMIDTVKENGLVNWVVQNGGSIHPLYVPFELSSGTGLSNPSILIDGNKILVNLRHLNYTLHHSEQNRFDHYWGPLQYLHPEDDITLTTYNILLTLDKDYNVVDYKKVNTDKLDVKPLWTFIGLEDARLIKWNNKIYLCGVRRDTTTTGEGRMELSELKITKKSVKEISRFRIPTPINPKSYCEKNWMPILDMPYHFVKWCNPTEIVKVDVEKQKSKTIVLEEASYKEQKKAFRGGSQVLPYQGGYVALTHEVDLYNNYLGKKNGEYLHRFIYWDKDWNIKKVSEDFSFLKARVEFAVGMAYHKENILITFGFQDNSAYLIRMPINLLDELLTIVW